MNELLGLFSTPLAFLFYDGWYLNGLIVVFFLKGCGIAPNGAEPV